MIDFILGLKNLIRVWNSKHELQANKSWTLCNNPMSSSCSGNKWIDVTCTNLHNQVIHNAHKFATRLGSDDVVSVLFRSPFCFQGHNCLPPFLKPSPFPTWPYPISPRLSVSLFLTKSHQASLSPCDLEIFANDNPKSYSGVFHQQGISSFVPGPQNHVWFGDLEFFWQHTYWWPHTLLNFYGFFHKISKI